MKVLYVTHSGLISGAERALLDLLAVLPVSVRATVACPPGPFTEALRDEGIDVVEFAGASGGLRLDPRYSLTTLRQIVVSGTALRKIVTNVQPDIIHANSLRAGLIAGAARPFTSTPTVVHVHDALPASTAAALVRVVLRRTADAVITISEYTRENFAGKTGRANVHVLENPLNTALYDPASMTKTEARAKLGLNLDDELVGLVAQITPWKGQDLAIQALGLLHRRHPRARLILVGEAKFIGRSVRFDNLAYLDRLRQLVAELGLGHSVEFWGERSDVPTIMRALDVLVGPSWEEPFGRSLIEGMAMKAAVVATSVGGPPEYIDHGTDGILIAPEDPGAWASAIAELLDDPDQREALGERASQKVRSRFDRGPYCERVLHVYDELIHDSSARADRRAARRRSCHPDPRCSNGSHVEARSRILFVEHSSVLGGGQRSLIELMRVLGHNHEVTLACPPGPLALAAAALDIPVAPIPESQLTFRFALHGTPRELARSFLARAAVSSHVRRLQPDLVHANSVRAGLLATRVRFLYPTIVHCRDLLPPGWAATAVRKLILSLSSEVVAVSEAVALRMTGDGRTDEKVSVIDNPVDLERFDPLRFDKPDVRRRLGVQGAPILGVIAQITPWKGQIRAVNILERVKRTHPGARLLIVGEAKFVSAVTRYDNQAYERELHGTVDRLGLNDAVSFLGDREDIEEILAALDVLLVPSTEEPFGRSVIEALAMGQPVIATNHGGPAEVIRPGKDGVVLDPDDLDAWALAATSLADRGLRLESRDYARARFSPGVHAAGVVSVYQRALTNTRGRRYRLR